MFICTNCKKEKPESERSSLRWLAIIGFHFMARMPWWPSEVCKPCSKQVLLFSLTGIIVAAVITMIIVLGNLLS